MKKILIATLALCSLCFSFSANDDPKIGPMGHVNYAIFGKTYAKTPIVDSKLVGHVYYIVSGHGGPDPGAMFKKDGQWLCEDEYAYDVSLRLARSLISHKAKVYMIIRDENDGIRDSEFLKPDKDETVWGGDRLPVNQRARLRQRSETINALYAENKAKGYQIQRTIVTHVDSRYQNHKVDIFFYHNPNSKVGESLAQTMYRTIKNEYDEHQQGRGYEGVVKPRDLWMLREVLPATIYIELGNIANDFDQKRLLIPNNRQAIANWLVAGVLAEN